MSKNLVIPALFCHSLADFKSKVKKIQRFVTIAQIDVMDGTFTSAKTFCDPVKIKKIKTPLRYELHLMTRRPEEYLAAWWGNKKIVRVFIHVELGPKTIKPLFAKIKDSGWQAGLAINPSIPSSRLAPLLSQTDVVMFMGDKAGQGQRQPTSQAVRKVKNFHQRQPGKKISFDIGVNDQSAKILRAAGVNNFVSGGYIFSGRVTDNVKKLERIIK